VPPASPQESPGRQQAAQSELSPSETKPTGHVPEGSQCVPPIAPQVMAGSLPVQQGLQSEDVPSDV
jgi:hypothetical protein